MTEYFIGQDGVPVGPEFDELSDSERGAINACVDFFAANSERMKHFAGRVAELGRSGADTAITLINVDDPSGHGKLLADFLMPGEDWQQYRDRGEIPIARGLVNKGAFPEILAKLGYHVAARELAGTDDLQVIVLHAQTVQILDVTY